MALNLASILPSDTARILARLKENGPQELEAAIASFLSNAPQDATENDLIFSTAAELSDVGIFGLVNTSSLARVLSKAPPKAADVFLSAVAEPERSSIAKARQTIAIADYMSGAAIASLLRINKHSRKRRTRHWISAGDNLHGYWMNMRVGSSAFSKDTLDRLRDNHVNAEKLLLTYKAATANLRKDVLTYVYIKGSHDPRFSVINPDDFPKFSAKIKEIETRTSKTDSNIEEITSAIASEVIGSDADTSMEAVLQLLAGAATFERHRQAG